MKKLRWGVIGAGGIADRRTIPGMLMAENAQQVFSDTPNYFYTTFKRRYGISPAKYRKELRLRSE